MSRKVGGEQSDECENEIDHKAPSLHVMACRIAGVVSRETSPMLQQWSPGGGSSTVSIGSQGLKKERVEEADIG
jgi:hypothetical protein